MMLITIISVVMIFVITTFAYRTAEVDNLKVRVEAEKMCNSVKSSINQAFTNGPGSSYNITMPQKLFGFDYTATVHSQNRLIILSWKNTSASCPTITTNVTNTTHQTFDILRGSNIVRNNNGIITFTPS